MSVRKTKITSTNPANPCPCCGNKGGKCGSKMTDFDLPIESKLSFIKGEQVFCMDLRGDTTTHKYTGETQNGNWGKYISHELSAQLSTEWELVKKGRGSEVDTDKQLKIRQELKSRHEERLRQRQIGYEKSQKSWQNALLSEQERDLEIRKVLKHLDISDRDYQNLLGRGFDREQIFDYEYKSIQVEQPLAEEVSCLLAGVKKDGAGLNNYFSGMVLPIRNEKGLYTGWQYKANLVGDEKKKYSWPKTLVPDRDYDITSHQKESLELPLIYCNPYSGSVRNDYIGLAEGTAFKPQLAADRFNHIVIGASGGHFASSPKTFQKYLNAASVELGGTKNILLYADAGSVKNHHVLRDYSKVADFAEQSGYSLKFAWWNQVEKKVGDIDEINTDTNISQISPKDFFALGKQHSDWHPDDEVQYRESVNKVLLKQDIIKADFTEKLSLVEDRLGLKNLLSEYEDKHSKMFGDIKSHSWKNLENSQKDKIKSWIAQNNVQQARVEKIVPILGAYLKHCQKNRVENGKTIVEWNRDRKTISYQDKVNPLEVLKAQYVDGKWCDCGSKISASKTQYFVKEVAPKINGLTLKPNSSSLSRS